MVKVKLIMLLSIVVSMYYYFSFLGTIYKVPKKGLETKTVKEDNTNYELEEYVLGVLACEMPASFDIEALKAQAVVARTFALIQNKDVEKLKKSTSQCYKDIEDNKSIWKDKYDMYYNKLKQAVNDTKGEVVYKNSKMLKTYYFSTSNGYTEDSMTVFKNDASKSVESSWDKQSSTYKKEVLFTKTELTKLLGNFNTIKITKRNKTNRVEEVYVDDKLYTGIKFRELLHLRSTDFNIKENGATYIITTYGYGHGVGMSQYGASYLAKDNKDYKYIIDYYYQNTEIKNIYA